jgi:beta-N-acetylhexosaminidase
MFKPCQAICEDVSAYGYIKKMSLGEKVGQVILLGFKNRKISKEDIAHIKKIKPGGIIFYSRNFEDVTKVAGLIDKIKSIDKKNSLPLFYAIDQEGGVVHRIGGDLYKPPSAPSIGAAGSEGLAKEVGVSVGRALNGLGININLSPVLDVPDDILTSPMTERSFGTEHDNVQRLGSAYIKGLKKGGVLSTAKHFPGIGRAHEDSHRSMPRIIRQTEEEMNKDLLPFRGAIEAGVDIIMVGHVIAEPGDSLRPVSVSSYWMEDVLRGKMGFEGLIIVDNIEMKAIEKTMPIAEAAVLSFKAGADIIMVSHERENQKAVFNALMDAVRKGIIPIERLDDSVKRIISKKIESASYKTGVSEARSIGEISRQVAESSVTAIKLKDSTPPDTGINSRALYAGYNLNLHHAIKETFRHFETLNTPIVMYKKIHPDVVMEEFLGNFDALIIDAEYLDAGALVSICDRLNLKYVIVLRRPWDILKTLEKFRPAWIVLAFDKSRIHLRVVSEVIAGSKKARGRLPYNLELPSDYEYD